MEGLVPRRVLSHFECFGQKLPVEKSARTFGVVGAGEGSEMHSFLGVDNFVNSEQVLARQDHLRKSLDLFS